MTSRSESLPSTMPTRTPELRCGDRAVANVPPVVHALERDLTDGRVRASDRIANVTAGCRDAEHAAAGRHEAAIALRRSRVKDVNAVECRDLHARDGEPRRVPARITARDEVDADGWLGLPRDASWQRRALRGGE